MDYKIAIKFREVVSTLTVEKLNLNSDIVILTEKEEDEVKFVRGYDELIWPL